MRKLFAILIAAFCSMAWGAGKAAVTPNVINIVHQDSAELARDLAEHFTLALDSPCKVMEEKDFSGGTAFYVGLTDYAAKHGFSAKTFPVEGWAYRSIGSNVILVGHPHRGTANTPTIMKEYDKEFTRLTFDSSSL